MRLQTSFAALLAVVALAACEENAVRDLTAPLPAARIKFFNFGVNAPSVHFYANDTKVTATSVTTCQAAAIPPVTATDSACVSIGVESTAGVGYGGVGSGGLYAGIEPGQYTLTGRITATTDKGLAISTLPATIEEGKFYSVYQSGFYNTTAKTVDAFIVEDDFPAAIDWTTAYVRFVNAISNAEPMTLYATNTDPEESQVPIAIGGAVAYQSGGAFVAVPAGSYNLAARYTGSATDQIVRANVPFVLGRVYTITARGDITVTSTTATNRPFLDNTLNR